MIVKGGAVSGGGGLFRGYLEDFCDLRAVIVLNGGAESENSLLIRLEAPGDLS